jgi:hypothetical protein
MWIGKIKLIIYMFIISYSLIQLQEYYFITEYAALLNIQSEVSYHLYVHTHYKEVQSCCIKTQNVRTLQTVRVVGLPLHFDKSSLPMRFAASQCDFCSSIHVPTQSPYWNFLEVSKFLKYTKKNSILPPYLGRTC